MDRGADGWAHDMDASFFSSPSEQNGREPSTVEEKRIEYCGHYIYRLVGLECSTGAAPCSADVAIEMFFVIPKQR